MKFDQIAPFVRYVHCQEVGFHTNYKTRMAYDCRLFYTLEGAGEIKIGKTVHKMQKGDLAIINSGIPYLPTASLENSVRYIAINFDCTQDFAHITQSVNPSAPPKFASKNILSHMNFEDAPSFDSFFVLPNMFRAGALAQQILDEKQRQLVGCQAKINALMAEILTECLRVGAAYHDASRLKDVLDYLHRAYREPLSNADIAARFGYHPNYLSRLFLNITGKSMYQYLLSIRIAKAKELLEATELSVGEVAEQCGFDNASNFSAAFRKVTSLTPTQCRKNGRFV